MSIYLPARFQKQAGESKNIADTLINMTDRICAEHPDKFEVAHWAGDVERIFKAGKIALPMGMENGLKGDDPAANKPLIEKLQKENPPSFSDVKMVVNHIDHVVALAGVDHVGFGSDFDGVGDSLPVGLKDVSQFPNLIAELLRRGYSESDIGKFCSGSLMRVWKAVEAYAKKQ